VLITSEGFYFCTSAYVFNYCSLMTTFKVALIGFGFGGRIFHAPFIEQTAGLELVQIMTNNSHHIAQAQKEYPHAKIIATYEEAIQHDDIDVIVLATPNKFHFSYAIQAIEAGKYVVVEKPFTVTSEEGELLIRLAQQKNRLLTVHHNRRWDSDYLTVKQVIADGLLGDLMEYEAHFDRFRNYIKPHAWKEVPEDEVVFYTI